MEQIDILLSLTELGIPPDRAAKLINEVPAEEISFAVLAGAEWDIPLGLLIDNLAYRSQRLSERWDSALVNVWRDSPPISLAHALFDIVQTEAQF